jgi:hypothetical protein
LRDLGRGLFPNRLLNRIGTAIVLILPAHIKREIIVSIGVSLYFHAFICDAEDALNIADRVVTA